MSDDPFSPFRDNTIGYHHIYETPYGMQSLIYADWTASGRLYVPIEEIIRTKFGPWLGNTHSRSSMTGQFMTESYAYAANRIKILVGADEHDVLLPCGSGSTAAINKIQRILGLRIHERWKDDTCVPESQRPVIFVSHMEHHSNHTSWLETIGDVVCLPPNEEGQVDPRVLNTLLKAYTNRETKIGAFTACSNVTGVIPPYYELAKVMHEHNGVCFIDFSASAPYTPINMHPDDPSQQLDAIFLSPHKFLGGPGSCGILVFNGRLYRNQIPDHPGGGTVEWTNPWGDKSYVSQIEIREDGGTPGILQLIRAALAFQVKEELLGADMEEREGRIVRTTLKRLKRVPALQLLDGQLENRLAIFSFCLPHLHYNLVVRLLNDHFGIQSRGGCSCAGTYGHYLLHINEKSSKHITDLIDQKDYSQKPGWVRISLHPMMSDEEIHFIVYALEEIAMHGIRWAKDYVYDARTNEFHHKSEPNLRVKRLFSRVTQRHEWR